MHNKEKPNFSDDAICSEKSVKFISWKIFSHERYITNAYYTRVSLIRDWKCKIAQKTLCLPFSFATQSVVFRFISRNIYTTNSQYIID